MFILPSIIDKVSFISTQLTKYLRDYLEGKKRMTLVFCSYFNISFVEQLYMQDLKLFIFASLFRLIDTLNFVGDC